MVLKHYLRGSILILCTLVAFSVVTTVVIKRALSIIDSTNGTGVLAESGAITELVSNSISNAANFVVYISLIVIGACWVVGVIDSYRIGITHDQ